MRFCVDAGDVEVQEAAGLGNRLSKAFLAEKDAPKTKPDGGLRLVGDTKWVGHACIVPVYLFRTGNAIKTHR